MGKKRIELSDLDININTVVKNVTRTIGIELANSYYDSIQAFYADYKPHRYKRTNSLFEGVGGVESKNVFNKRIGKNHYECGIHVSEEYIDGDPYVNQHHSRSMDGIVNKSWVLPRAFESGIHGYTIAEYWAANRDKTRENRLHFTKIPKMKPTPETLVKRDYNAISKTIFEKLWSAF